MIGKIDKQNGKQTITVLIADDHPLFREGIKFVLQRDQRISSIIEAKDGTEALKLIEQHNPTLAILDLDMPNYGGLEITELVTKKQLPTKVIILTMHDGEEMFNRAMNIGVMGYILKDSIAGDIMNCITSVLEDEPFITPSLLKYLVKRTKTQSSRSESDRISQLTPTERKVLILISQGKTTKEIAEELFSSPKTIENHRTNICNKLDVHGTNALFRFAVANQKLLE